MIGSSVWGGFKGPKASKMAQAQAILAQDFGSDLVVSVRPPNKESCLRGVKGLRPG